ncbi:MAG: DUF4344 domain-containing metallopeptidase [Pseudomonadota bacterium]
MKRLVFALMLLALPAHAGTMDKRIKDFVAANMLAIYYHEFGHALIDIMKLPIFGQEEDAADVLSAVLVHDFFEEDTTMRIADATAAGFLGDMSITDAEKADVIYWGVHGPDLQRYYTFVCLIYGANPEARRGFADKFELPDGRRRTCPEEFAQAFNAWGPVIRDLVNAGGGSTIRFLADHRTGEHGRLLTNVIEREVKAMNNDMSLPKRLLVRVEACDTVNAFYDPKRREIIMCTEFAEYLADVVP